MNAPTVWEEGRWSGRRVTRLAMLVCALLVAVDVLASGRLGRIFDSGFITVCIAMALAVRPQDFFRIGVLPPTLLLGIAVVLGLGHRSAVAASGDGFIQSVISGLARHSGPLLVGYALTLIVLGIRVRVGRRHSKRVASPAPYRMISGTPEVRSTTVVGSEPASPSMTASSS